MIKQLISSMTVLAFFSALIASHNELGLSQEQAVFSTRASSKILQLPKGDDVFHFIIYGDRTTGVPEGLKFLQQAVVDTNLLDPDLVMTVGDLVQGYNKTNEWLQQKDEYVAIMNQLKMQWYPVAGNHDVYWERNDPAKPKYEHESNYESHFGPLWYSFKHKNAGFIVLYSDEGDRETGEKGFNEGRLQQMSAEQLEFLNQALADCKSMDHVFVFLHHPRWIGGGYTGSNWDQVHQMLVDAGNVSAVFAGHIHHMRYDGAKDGIEYFTLAATGGNLDTDFPAAGYLHHFNVVSVRKDAISVATIPVGAVVDPKQFTPDFIADLELAHQSCRPTSILEAFPLVAISTEPMPTAFEFTNQSQKAIELTIELSNLPENARVFPDHQHLFLEPKESGIAKFRVSAPQSTQDSEASSPALRISGDYLGSSARVALPVQQFSIPLRVPEEILATLENNQIDDCLVLDTPPNCIKISNETMIIPDGPFTIEAWVQQTDANGAQAVIAKTQNSEFAIAVNNGLPQFDIRYQNQDKDAYAFAKSDQALPINKWVHLAGVFDEQTAKLFVDGKMVSSVPAVGQRVRNALSTFLGADPDKSDQPNRFFKGKIDEVRFSKVARYAMDFQVAALLPTDGDTLAKFSFESAVGKYLVDDAPAHRLVEIVGELRREPAMR